MALDHVRDFFHDDAMVHDPLDLDTTTPALFFTRWITNFCAPAFVFLSGLSAYLSGLRKSVNNLSASLIKRGLWLIFIEITVVTFGWTFNPYFETMVLQVIWAIGISMIVLGAACRLPQKWIWIIAIIILAGHNLLDNIPATHQGFSGFIWDMFHHAFSKYTLNASHNIFIVYPVLPWIGIMLLGYAFGQIFRPEIGIRKRKQTLWMIGSGMIIFFVLFRFFNLYGNPTPWHSQNNPVYSFLSFLDVCKYPPSLLFTCITLGPALLFLGTFENKHSFITRFFCIFGRVPFFYYILHIYTIHILTVLLFYSSGYNSMDIVTPGSFFLFRPANLGYGLWFVYTMWAFVIMILYLPCKWYDEYKSKHQHWWLSYL